jgi:hypothetical protein
VRATTMASARATGRRVTLSKVSASGVGRKPQRAAVVVSARARG